MFGENDSTVYEFPGDSSVLAGVNTLYFENAGQLYPIRSFSSPEVNNGYIRDLNIIDRDRWYLVLGSRFIAGTTELWRTDDAGRNWFIDSSFYQVTLPDRDSGIIADHRSISQFQHWRGDTFILYVSYYQAGIYYSTDRGSSWQRWLTNTPAHYHLLLPCPDQRSHHLFSLEGDAIQAYTFSIPDSLVLSPDTGGFWNQLSGSAHPQCFQAGQSGCTYHTFGTRYDQYLSAIAHLDSICGDLPTSLYQAVSSGESLRIYPNPSNGQLRIDSPFPFDEIRLHELGGREIGHWKYKPELDLSDYPAGSYLIQFSSADQQLTRPLILR